MQEHRTARRITEAIASPNLDVTTEVGGTGIVAVLRNGEGPTVMLRAGIDALPVEEKTGLSYASTARGRDHHGNDVPIAHACGHDVHATCLVGALRVLDQVKDSWSGTVVAVFQPAEELLRGAKDMIADGLFERFPRPDIVLGQHVTALPAGVIGYCLGPMLAATRPRRTRIPAGEYDRYRRARRLDRDAPPGRRRARSAPGRDSRGHRGQVARRDEGQHHPDDAELGINVRSFSSEVRLRVIEAVERIVRGEAAASGVERQPHIDWHLGGPVLHSDPDATSRTVAAFTERFGAERVVRRPPATASEDVGHFGAELGVPTVFWLWGGGDPEQFARAEAAGRLDQDVPFNHSPEFAPIPEPTLSTGVEALVTAALTWLDG